MTYLRGNMKLEKKKGESSMKEENINMGGDLLLLRLSFHYILV